MQVAHSAGGESLWLYAWCNRFSRLRHVSQTLLLRSSRMSGYSWRAYSLRRHVAAGHLFSVMLWDKVYALPDHRV